MRSTTTPSSPRICSIRSALPVPSAAMNTLKPVALERVEPLRERVGIADDRIERARGEDRRFRRIGNREHGHRLRFRVREQAVEREREPGRVVVVDVLAPRGGERLRERGLLVEQLLGAVAQPAGLDDRDERRRREQVGQEPLVGSEPRQPRLHAVEGVALGEPLPLLAPPGLGDEELARAGPHLVGRQQLAHREDPRLVDLRRSIADRRRRSARAGRPRRPTGRCAPGGRRWRDTRRRSSRAPRPRRAPRPGTRAGNRSSTSRATSSSRSICAPLRTTTGSTSSTCGPSRCTSARTGATIARGR